MRMEVEERGRRGEKRYLEQRVSKNVKKNMTGASTTVQPDTILTKKGTGWFKMSG